MSVDCSDKIILNGVDVVNINELSPSQNRALLKFIEANRDLLSVSDKPDLSSSSNVGRNSRYGDHHYGSNASGLNHDKYNTLDSSYSAPFSNSDRNSTYSGPQKRKEVSWSDAIDSLGNQQHPRSYSSLGRGSNNYLGATNEPLSSSNKQDRSRSYSPTVTNSLSGNKKNLYKIPPRDMAGYYGSQQTIPQTPQSMYARDRTISPLTNYASQIRESRTPSTYVNNPAAYDSHTSIIHDVRRSLTPTKRPKEFDDSKFGGFGNRPGSGVELVPSKWHGGEIITDPSQLPKGLKTKKIYYSPIGDGTVAADGVELKKLPPDLTPKVEVIHQRTVERKGNDGHSGLKIYEKEWTEGGGSGGASNLNSHLTSDGPFSGLGDGSKTDPFGKGNDPFGKGGDPYGKGGDPFGKGGDPYGKGGDPYGKGSDPYGKGDNLNDPFGSLSNIIPARSNNASPYKSYPTSESQFPTGRDSTGSSMFGDSTRSRRFEIKTDYMITNPRELIHQYATTTPTAVLDITDNHGNTRTLTTKSSYSATSSSYKEEASNYSPYAPYHSTNPNLVGPKKFVQQLRDETLTSSQKEANTHLNPLNERDMYSQQKLDQIKRETVTKSMKGYNDVDNLTERMIKYH
uniref:ZM domain-containing protein n=1 Tax=Parastrongyloides trichosuri TaxID=131310 RepID=A0A0N4ZRQ5_PARTI